MNIRYYTMTFMSDGQGAVAYVSPDQTPKDLCKSFDANATLDALYDAIGAIQRGDGVEAAGAAGEAFARLAFYHRS